MNTRIFPGFRLGLTTLVPDTSDHPDAALQRRWRSRRRPPPAHAASAATEATIRGRVTHHDTHEPVAGARVVVEELNRETTTGSDGAYAIGPVAAGTYHLRITAQGFGPTRVEATVQASAQGAQAQQPAVDVELEPELHYSEVLSVSPNARDPFESYQPTTVLSGQDLTIQMAGSLGAVLQNQPGVAQRSFGPGPSRPVIRGLDGDRVLLLENGQRIDDLSSQSADHGVPINPAAASRLEVVRGPATLLHGANAIGGLVNIVTDVIPTKRVERTEGAMQFGFRVGRVGSGGRRGRQRRRRPVRAARRRQRTPLRRRRHAARHDREFTVAIGLRSRGRVADHGQGLFRRRVSVRRHEIRHPDRRRRQHPVDAAPPQRLGARGIARAERADFVGARVVRRAALPSRRTRRRGDRHALQERHDAVRAARQHAAAVRPACRAPTACRASRARSPRKAKKRWLRRSIRTTSRPSPIRRCRGRTSRCSSAHASSTRRSRPTPSSDLIDRDFTNVSGSAGVLFRPSDATTVAVSLARAVRNPALEELYFFGIHPGNFAFEIGNDESRRREGARLRRVVPLAPRAGVRRGQLLPQQHRQLHLPQSDRRGGGRLPGDPVHRRRQPAAGRRGAHRHRDLIVVDRRSGLRHGARRAARDQRSAAADSADAVPRADCDIATTRCRRAAKW